MQRFFLWGVLLLCSFVSCIQFKRILLTISYILAFTFPVFAEDEAYTFDSDVYQFTYEQNLAMQLDQVEEHIVQNEIDRQNEISAILSEPLRSPHSEATLAVDRVDDSLFHYASSYLGDLTGAEFNYFRIQLNDGSFTTLRSSSRWLSDYTGYFDLTDYPEESFNYLIANYKFTVDGSPVFVSSDRFTSSDLYSAPIVTDTFRFSDFVSSILSWFLASFTALTSWILADSIAAVFASIFLVGCAFAMLFRVLHSV